MLRQDLQRDMLLDDLRRQVAQRAQIVDMAGILQHRIGQRPRRVPAA
jgi:hypothetical protein